MAASAAAVGVRFTAFQEQGDREKMEDYGQMLVQRNKEGEDNLWAVFGVYDGHGGTEAAEYTRDHLIETIRESPKFWSGRDDQVVSAIREGFHKVHDAMYKEMWPQWKTRKPEQLAVIGTTASICFVMRGKLYVAHVGDSAIVLGRNDPLNPFLWKAERLTKVHRPEDEVEFARICSAGGKVVRALDMPRVVWSKPTMDVNSGQMRYTDIAGLNMSRSLGDFWSYNPLSGKYVVSPDPEVSVYKLNMTTDRCIILATDGLWDHINDELAVNNVRFMETENLKPHTPWISPSKQLCSVSSVSCRLKGKRNDNITVITVIFSHPDSVVTAKQPILDAEKETLWRLEI